MFCAVLFALLCARNAHAQDNTPKSWIDFSLGSGIRPYAGVSWMGGPVLPVTNTAGSVEGNFLFALRGGVLIGTQEIGAEVSPLTYFYAPNIKGPALQANLTFGNYFRLSDHFFYPLRVGAGIIAINTPNDNVFFQVRGDVIGLAFEVGHILLELHAPSFRWATNFQSPTMTHFFTWEIGLSATYIL